MTELRVTAEGMPSLSVDGTAFPLFFSLIGNKRWAEHRGQTFEEVMAGGWSPAELGLEDLGRLLLIALEGGELRRHLCVGGERRTMDGILVDRVLERYHANEIIGVLLAAWNHAPSPSDPPTPPASPSAGGGSSE